MDQFILSRSTSKAKFFFLYLAVASFSRFCFFVFISMLNLLSFFLFIHSCVFTFLSLFVFVFVCNVELCWFSMSFVPSGAWIILFWYYLFYLALCHLSLLLHSKQFLTLPSLLSFLYISILFCLCGKCFPTSLVVLFAY